MRKVLGVLLALTCAVLVLDLARPSWTEPVRAASASVFTPVQQAIRGWDRDELDRVAAERDRLAVEVERLRGRQDAALAAGDLDLPGTAGLRPVGARVVAATPQTSPAGARVVTIDAGSRQGVRADRTVLNADGLVGRVLRVDPSSAEVVLLGDRSVVVGVRVGREGALGSLSATAPSEVPRRGADELTLTAIGDSPMSVGDVVRTLGSPGDVPYSAGIEVGTVTSVDPDSGQLAGTAVVRPAVDADRLDTVVVLTGGQRP
ncbi:MAG TPA: rod shape-determining protein MreC [Ornithinimicrobium sp.]|uniref:rod shape-determining protein MreC n=1 Tax=Ornithinimicrobium sp. TaxID=1977084 RepID=UPI002B4A8116|nr:rod shape-determining protein MreC [Ornithinimicrobium sp.]HKJ12227.1 rod shape-determining protein MreC [Ornithinimicrobium sp.]